MIPGKSNTSQASVTAGEAAEWASVNRVLAYKEIGLEIDTFKIKIGDGEKKWLELGYWSRTNWGEMTLQTIVTALGFTPSQFSGNYADLSGKPTLFDGQYSSLTGAPSIPTTLPATIGAPSAGNAISSGTAFQPSASTACLLSVQSTLSGIVGITGLVTVSMCATSGGVYTTVSTTRLLISVLAVTADQDTGTIPVPSGWYVKITLSGGVTATYTKWTI